MHKSCHHEVNAKSRLKCLEYYHQGVAPIYVVPVPFLLLGLLQGALVSLLLPTGICLTYIQQQQQHYSRKTCTFVYLSSRKSDMIQHGGRTTIIRQQQ